MQNVLLLWFCGFWVFMMAAERSSGECAEISSNAESFHFFLFSFFEMFWSIFMKCFPYTTRNYVENSLLIWHLMHLMLWREPFDLNVRWGGLGIVCGKVWGSWNCPFDYWNIVKKTTNYRPIWSISKAVEATKGF